jgi:polysaccharide export outer membrane protein
MWVNNKSAAFLIAIWSVFQMFSTSAIAMATETPEHQTAAEEMLNVFDVLTDDSADESSRLSPAGKSMAPLTAQADDMMAPDAQAKTLVDPAKGYRMAPGDKLSIRVFGEDNLSMNNLKLGNQGTINYPFLGEIRVAGLTVAGLERLIVRGLSDGYLVNPQVRVNIVEYRQFYVNGEVKRPGGYAFQPGLTLRKAISLAGGFSKGASEGQVLVIHEDAPTEKAEQMPLDAGVSPGDIITVKQSLFYVNGEVNRPGGYAFQPDLTVRMAVSLAGGFTERASRGEVQVIRKNNPDQGEIDLPLTAEVLPGDIITVEQSFF